MLVDIPKISEATETCLNKFAGIFMIRCSGQRGLKS